MENPLDRYTLSARNKLNVLKEKSHELSRLDIQVCAVNSVFVPAPIRCVCVKRASRLILSC